MNIVRTSQGWRLDGEGVSEANRFLEFIDLRGLAPSSMKTYAMDLLVIWRWMAATQKRWEALGHADWCDFIRDHRGGQCPCTLNRRLRLLHRYLRFLYPGRFPPHVGRRRTRAWGLPTVREPVRIKPPLTVRQIERVLRGFRTWRDRLMAVLMWTMGLRAGELLSLTVSDLRLPEGVVRICGKGGRERTLPLPSPAMPLAQRYLTRERPDTATDKLLVVLKGPRRGHPLTYAGLRRLFRYHRQRLGIAEAHPHRFRHTFAVHMIRNGVSIPMLMRLMGHSHPSTTLRYITFRDQEMREDYEKALHTLGLEKHLRAIL